MSTFLWSLCAFWAVVYGLRACKSVQSPLLPIASKYSKTTRGGRNIEISLSNFHLKVQTAALNSNHNSLTALLERAEYRIIRVALTLFYDVGTLCCVIGVFIGLAALSFTSVQYVLSAFASRREAPVQRLLKRSNDVLDIEEQQGFAIKPIIPGVTVPLSHLPFILLALFMSQCFHELGHAVAAAVDGVPLQAIGASLMLILPSAFVSLASSMNDLPAVARLRVIASGAWHNLLLWGLISLLSVTSLSSVWTLLGWEDISDRGVVVLNVKEDSPLAYHMQPGTLVLGLDDYALGGDTLEDRWSRYLLASEPFVGKGWCVDHDSFFSQPSSCCDHNAVGNPLDHPPTAQLSCFLPIASHEGGHCVDPVPVLDVSQSERCSSDADCNEDMVADARISGQKACVLPDKSSQLLRIAVNDPERSPNDVPPIVRTVLWSGPREEVWEQVGVGKLTHRYRMLPLWLPDASTTFFGYLSTLSLSLFIFNLFPLPFLDGSYFLSAMLDYVGTPHDQTFYGSRADSGNDIELGVRAEELRRPETYSTELRRSCTHAWARAFTDWIWKWRQFTHRRKSNIEHGVKICTIVLMCTSVIAMVLSG